MPLIHIDVVRGRDEQALRILLDTVHDAMVAAFKVPETDRYQVLNQHERYEIVALDTDLGYRRTEDVVIIRLISRARSATAKADLYRRLAADLKRRCDVGPEDLIVSIVENGGDDWSFGRGEAQFVTGQL